MTVLPEPEPTPTPEPTPPEPPEPTPPEPKKPDPIAEQRRRADAEKRRADALQKQIDDAAREEAEKKGEWEQLAATEKTAREAAEAKATRLEAERTVERIASQPQFGRDPQNPESAGTRFINPDEALALLPAGTDTSDPSAVQSALEALAVTRPHLLQTAAQAPAPQPTVTPPSGGPVKPPGTEPQKFTREQVAAMSPAEVAAYLNSDRRDEILALNGGS